METGFKVQTNTSPEEYFLIRIVESVKGLRVGSDRYYVLNAALPLL